MLVSNDSMFDQATKVIRDGHSTIHILELNQLNYFIERVVNNKMVILDLDLSIQCVF